MPSKLSGAGWRKGSSVCVSAKRYKKKTLNDMATCVESFEVTEKKYMTNRTQMAL